MTLANFWSRFEFAKQREGDGLPTSAAREEGDGLPTSTAPLGLRVATRRRFSFGSQCRAEIANQKSDYHSGISIQENPFRNFH